MRLFRRALAAVVLLLLVPATAQAGLIGRWNFDEGSGAVAHDSSGSGLDGQLDATTPPAWIGGVEGTALHFDGGGVRLPASQQFEPPAITIAAWVRNAGSPGTFRYVFSKGGSSCYRSSYGLYTGADGGAAFYAAGDGAYTISPAVAPGQIWDGRWHRLAGTYDGTTVRLYVDGAQVRQGIAGPSHLDYGLDDRIPFIGTYQASCVLPFVGDVDAPSMWSDALSATALAVDATPPAPIAPSPGQPKPKPQPIGPSGRHPSVSHGSTPGVTFTPPHCVSLRVGRRSIRVGKRTRLGVTVHKGARRMRRAHVLLRGRRLHKSLRTDRRGRGRFTVRVKRHQRHLTVRVAGRRRTGCGAPKAFVRVRAHHKHRAR